MKILGALLIFSAFFCFGLLLCAEKMTRKETLTQLCFSIELIFSELSARASPLPELINLLAERSGPHAARFFGELAKLLPMLGSTEFSRLWKIAVDKTLDCLSGDEAGELTKLGCILGRYELSEQLASVSAALAYFRAQRDAAREKSAEERRLSLGLSAVAGALLAIVFL